MALSVTYYALSRASCAPSFCSAAIASHGPPFFLGRHSVSFGLAVTNSLLIADLAVFTQWGTCRCGAQVRRYFL